MNANNTASATWQGKSLIVKDRILSDAVSFKVSNKSNTVTIDYEGLKFNRENAINHLDELELTVEENAAKKSVPSTYAISKILNEIREDIQDPEKFSSLLLPYILVPTIDPITHFPAFKICLEDNSFGKINRVFVSNPFAPEDTWEVEVSETAKRLRNAIPVLGESESETYTSMKIEVLHYKTEDSTNFYAFYDCGICEFVHPDTTNSKYIIVRSDGAGGWIETDLSTDDYPNYNPLATKWDENNKHDTNSEGGNFYFAYTYPASPVTTITRNDKLYSCKNTMIGILAPATPNQINLQNVTFVGDLSGAFSAYIPSTTESFSAQLDPVYTESITNLTISNDITAMNGTFMGQRALENLSITSNPVYTNVTDLANLFRECRHLKINPAIASLALANQALTNVVSVSRMFDGCGADYSTDLSTEVIISGMFAANNALKYAGGMFRNTVCTNITMFGSFTPASSVHYSDRSAEAEEPIAALFENCSKLTTISGISTWTTDAVENFSNIFNGCSELTAIDLENWSFANAKVLDNFIEGCNKVTSIKLKKRWLQWVTPGVTTNHFSIYKNGSLLYQYNGLYIEGFYHNDISITNEATWNTLGDNDVIKVSLAHPSS